MMMQPNVQKALKAANLSDDLRAVFVQMPSLKGPTVALLDYLTLLPTTTNQRTREAEPIAIACIRSAIDASRSSDGNFYSSHAEMYRFVRGLFEPFPAILRVTIAYVDPDDEDTECWVPFAESVAQFVERYPGATQINEPSPLVEFADDQRIRLIGAARILGFAWAEAAVGLQP